MKVKIKNVSGSKVQFDAAIATLRSVGAYARDNDYGFNPEKASIVVVDGKYIQKSRTDYKPKKVPYCDEMGIDVFNCLDIPSVKQFIGGAQAGAGIAPDDEKLPSGLDEAYAPEVHINFVEVKKESPCDQKTLGVEKATVLLQNSIIFKMKTIPFLINNGVDIVEDDGKYYVIDVTTNEAVEVTPKYIKEKAEADLVAGENTVYTELVTKFDLIDSIVLKKDTEKDEK